MKKYNVRINGESYTTLASNDYHIRRKIVGKWTVENKTSIKSGQSETLNIVIERIPYTAADEATRRPHTTKKRVTGLLVELFGITNWSAAEHEVEKMKALAATFGGKTEFTLPENAQADLSMEFTFEDGRASRRFKKAMNRKEQIAHTVLIMEPYLSELKPNAVNEISGVILKGNIERDDLMSTKVGWYMRGSVNVDAAGKHNEMTVGFFKDEACTKRCTKISRKQGGSIMTFWRDINPDTLKVVYKTMAAHA